MVRRILFTSVALAPIVVLIHYVFHPTETVDFVLAAAALIPLAWLIGEATEHAAEHTGPGIGGFLNATFGNAPELIIALFAVQRDGVRGRARVAHRLRRRQPPARARLLAALRRPRRDRPAVELPRARTRRRHDPAAADPVDPRLGWRSRARRAGQALDPGLHRPARRLRDPHRVLAPATRGAAHSERRGDHRLVAAARARRARARDSRHRAGGGDPRRLDRQVRRGVGAERVLPRGGRDRDRRQRGRARRRRRRRRPRQDQARGRDRARIERAGRRLPDPRRRAARRS